MRFLFLGRREPERIAALRDLPGRRGREMCPEDDDVGVRVFLAERAPRLLRHREVGVETIVPIRIFALNRVMHQVAGYDGFLTLRRNPHTVMTRGVAGRRLEPYLVGDAEIRVDQVGHPDFDDRTHRILDRIARVLAVKVRPVVPFGAADQVPRVGECRHPVAVLEHRVPAHVVDVQMRADDAIDVVARVTGLFEVAQERQLQIAPCRVGTNLLIADAGVDDDALALRLDHQRVDAHAELALLVRESWIEPVGFLLDVVAGGVRQEPGAGPWRLALDNPGYLDVADFELVHHDPPASRQLSPNFEDSPSVNVRYEVRYSYSRTNAPNGGNRDGKNSRRKPAEGYRRDRAAAQ